MSHGRRRRLACQECVASETPVPGELDTNGSALPPRTTPGYEGETANFTPEEWMDHLAAIRSRRVRMDDRVREAPRLLERAIRDGDVTALNPQTNIPQCPANARRNGRAGGAGTPPGYPTEAEPRRGAAWR